MQYYQTNLALGSEIQITLVLDKDDARASLLFHDIWHTIFGFERRFSRFLPASELSIFNAHAGLKHFISPEFRDILMAAKTISKETEGLFNPFILPALQQAGYGHSRVAGHENDSYDDYSLRHFTSIERLDIGDNWATIPYGTALDLGGCGKGYLADLLAYEFAPKVQGFWFSLGGDIAVGGSDSKGDNWQVSVQHAQSDGQPDIGRASMPDQRTYGVATSGITHHAGLHHGSPWHHLIDPVTLLPAKTDILMATIFTSSCFRADVFASCIVIKGSQHAQHLLETYGMQDALIQGVDQRGGPFQTRYGSLINMENLIK